MTFGESRRLRRRVEIILSLPLYLVGMLIGLMLPIAGCVYLWNHFSGVLLCLLIPVCLLCSVFGMFMAKGIWSEVLGEWRRL